MSVSSILLLAVLGAVPSESWLTESSSQGLGTGVSISGTTIAAGAPYDDTFGTNAGSVRVFVSGSLSQTLNGISCVSDDYFGQSVSISGERMAVGAPWYDGQCGVVNVFTRNSGTWGSPVAISAPDGVSGDRFGWLVALDGDWLAVSSPLRTSGRGAVYMFRWESPSWVWKQTIIPSYSNGDYGKYSLVLKANEWLFVGSPARNNIGTSDGVTEVRHYVAASTWWAVDQTLSPSDAADSLKFGYSVAYDGSTLVVGAPSFGTVAEGAYLFSYDGSDWVEDGKLTASDGTIGDGFGSGVTVSGPTIAVGAIYDGSVYVFVDNVERYKLSPPFGTASYVGRPMGIDGSIVVAGAPGSFTGKGSVVVYDVPAEANRLEFTIQPSSILLGGTITPQVTVYDQFDQVFTSVLSVTIDFGTNPTGASLTGTTTVSTSGGVAGYSLGVDTIGTGYTLSATSGTMSVISDAFNVTSPADPATKFVILNPTDGTVDSPITVTVQAQNSSNAVVTTYQDDVTLVASGSATGDGLVNIVNGIGTIQISDTVAETVVFTLQDSQSTGLNVSSTQNVLFGVGSATGLGFVVGPMDAQINTAMQPMLVAVLDQYGNLRSDTGISITLTLSSNPEGAVAYGTTTEATVGGDATFSNVLVDKAGTFTLVATSGALSSDVSSPFTVTGAPVPPDDDKICGAGPETSLLGWLLPLIGASIAIRRRK